MSEWLFLYLHIAHGTINRTQLAWCSILIWWILVHCSLSLRRRRIFWFRRRRKRNKERRRRRTTNPAKKKNMKNSKRRKKNKNSNSRKRKAGQQRQQQIRPASYEGCDLGSNELGCWRKIPSRQRLLVLSGTEGRLGNDLRQGSFITS